MLAILAQTKTGTSNLASTLVTFDNNTIVGNSIVVISGNSSTTPNDVSGVTDSQGNVYTKVSSTANGSVGELEIWYTSGIVGGANTVTVAYTTGVACAVIIREYNGTISASALDKHSEATGNSANLSSGNTSTLTQTSELLVGAGLIPLANTFSAGGSYVNLVSTGAPLVVAVAAEDLLVTTGGAQAATFTANASVQWVCAIASFLLLPTGTTTSTSSTSISSTSTSSTSISTSSTSRSLSTSSTSVSSTSSSLSTSSTSLSTSSTTYSTSSTSSSISSTSLSSTSSSTSTSSTSSSISSTSVSSTSVSSTSSSTSRSSTSTSFSSTSSSISSTSASTSSTSFSSTSSSSSTSSTTVPPPFIDYSFQDSVDISSQTVYANFGKTGAWKCPASVTSVVAECWAGGGGAGGGGVNNGGSGGGGGAYAKKTISVTPGTIYTVTVGTGGASAAVGANGGDGNDSWFSTSGTVLAKAGLHGIADGGAAGAGGLASGCIGDTTHSGGNGGAGNANNTGAGGGGSAGTTTDGGVGQDSQISGFPTGGVAGAYGGKTGALGGAAANGGTGAGSSGDVPGAGGGGGGTAGTGSISGPGGDGMVQISWTVAATAGLPTTGADLINPFTTAGYSDAAGDDGDYFIEYGSEYVITNYQRKDTNNTDNIQFAWRGRSTMDTRVSPMLFQIYNVNSATWETLSNINNIPADTDFSIAASRTSATNYYDSSNTVTFRTYQQVF